VKLEKLKSPPVLLATAAIALVLSLDIASRLSPKLDLLTRVEAITYDWRMKQASGVGASVATNLAFVSFSDDTIDVFGRGDLNTNYLKFGLYWPRHVYGILVGELKAQGAKVVGLDVLFAEERVDHRYFDTGRGQTPDAYFTNELRRAGNVVLAATPEVLPAPLFRASALALGGITTELDTDGVLRRVHAFHDFRVWHRDIQKQAQLWKWKLEEAEVTSNKVVFAGEAGRRELSLSDGLFDPYELLQQKPPGGVVRLQPAFENIRVWHLGLTLAAIQLGLDLNNAQVDPARGRIVLTSTNGTHRVLPVDKQAQLLIDWRVRRDDPRLTLASFEGVVNDHVLRQLGSNVTSRFQNKLVVVGSTAVGNDLTDLGATPLEKNTYLTSSHWNVANSLITGQFIRVTPRWLNFLLICLFGASGSVFACKLSTTRAALTSVLLAVSYVATATAAFVFARYWTPLVAPLLSLAAGYVPLMTYQAFFEKTERRRVKDIFSRLVAPSVVQELLKATNLSLIGKRRRVTVLFADIRGFTQMSDNSHARAEEIVGQEKLEGAEAGKIFDEESQEVLKTVNLYLGTIADTIKKHSGTLDKYIGDCVMAFWGAPTDEARHAVCCVQAAIEGQRAIYRLNEERRQENSRRERANFERLALGQSLSRVRLLEILSVGTGINTGTVDAGLMGSQDAQNYTVFGRDVNVASRIEKLAGSGRILIGETTFIELRKQDPALADTCIELPPTEVRGIREAIKIYEVPWK
jgi:class 3 adenylate cyclase/CHASE2 domain-containing sensor protein